jgi:probable addiction module antidote protein
MGNIMDDETKRLIEKTKTLPKWDDLCVEEYRKDHKLAAMRIKTELAEFEKTGEIKYLLPTLEKVAKAKGLITLERETGISRQNLYAVLNGKSAPRIDTMMKILNALGFTLSIKPVKKAA